VDGSGLADDAGPACASAAAGGQPDLTWLVHRAGQRLRTGLDGVAQAAGLQGGREWIVLAALCAEPGRTQLALGNELGLDKTTLTSLLDRLERDGLVVRRSDPRDRRARIPEITARGRQVDTRVAAGRDAAEDAVMAGFSPLERRQLRELLLRLTDGPGDLPAPGGSCM
jgi:DNA-binding MarR family transcriptional regulator